MPDSRYKVEPMVGLEVYKIGHEAIITLQPSTGYVAVSCGHHAELNGCHWWNSRGPESLHKFLMQLDRHYTMGKLFNRMSLREYDDEATTKEIHKFIIQCRRDGSMDREQARDLWDEVESAESPEDIYRLDGLDDQHEFVKYKDKSCAVWFWDKVWSAFIGHLKTIYPNEVKN